MNHYLKHIRQCTWQYTKIFDEQRLPLTEISKDAEKKGIK